MRDLSNVHADHEKLGRGEHEARTAGDYVRAGSLKKGGLKLTGLGGKRLTKVFLLIFAVVFLFSSSAVSSTKKDSPNRGKTIAAKKVSAKKTSKQKVASGKRALKTAKKSKQSKTAQARKSDNRKSDNRKSDKKPAPAVKTESPLIVNDKPVSQGTDIAKEPAATSDGQLLPQSVPATTNSTQTAAQAEVLGLSLESGKGFTKVVIDVSGRAKHRLMKMSAPERLCVDIKSARLSKAATRSLSSQGGIVKSVRAGQFDSDTARIVLELEGRADYEISESGGALVISLYVDGYKPPLVVKKVVIDAGHGGRDPGAVGRRGLKEKDVTLDIALKVREILSKDPSYEVYLTRETDVFIDLGKRTAIANRKNADLFVSVHANANPRREARGIETYLLNWTDDEEALRVAARENAISLRKMKEARSDVGMILASLELQTKRDDSLKLAHEIQGAMVNGLSDEYAVIDLGVKQALFYVLVDARMPSVLAEVSFISNAEEEALLRDDRYRMRLAEGIAQGLEKYLTHAPRSQEVARR